MKLVPFHMILAGCGLRTYATPVLSSNKKQFPLYNNRCFHKGDIIHDNNRESLNYKDLRFLKRNKIIADPKGFQILFNDIYGL